MRLSAPHFCPSKPSAHCPHRRDRWEEVDAGAGVLGAPRDRKAMGLGRRAEEPFFLGRPAPSSPSPRSRRAHRHKRRRRMKKDGTAGTARPPAGKNKPAFDFGNESEAWAYILSRGRTQGQAAGLVAAAEMGHAVARVVAL